MSQEIVAAERFLRAALIGDATLSGLVGTRAYGHIVPPEATLPYLYWTLVDANDSLTEIGATRVWSGLIYAVRLVDATEDFADLETGAAAIDSALHKASGSNVSGMVVACVREAPFALLEFNQAGNQLRHLGGRFRLFVQ